MEVKYMNKKNFKIQEFSGVIITICMAFLSWNAYHILNKNMLGILIGSVNNSIWELGKSLWLSYIIYGLFQMITVKPPLRQFTVAKFAGMFSIVLSYIALRSLFSEAFNSKINIIITC